ncbi:prolipoprotein diacylglyceryl transferase [Brevibacterium aurantiacum]|uniref:hypothetical protein n=1 Tax=Brevibacterium aurantiacum TaxID=273384 RepID=UPI001866E057|nr:hypothetical protein [Brevibacterium aurantiacum]
MRYLIALLIGIGVLFGINFFADLFSMPRPWGSLLMGATVGITMVVVLLIWEVVKPSNKDAAPAKPAMSEEERANARAERRSRLAAEAGVSLDDTDGGGSKPEVSSTEPRVPPIPPAAADRETSADGAESEPSRSEAQAEPQDAEASPEPDESSIEAEPTEAESAQDEPNTLAPDEFDEDATGSSLENPPTGEPGISVDALEDAEAADTDGAADDDPVGDESTTGESDSKS